MLFSVSRAGRSLSLLICILALGLSWGSSFAAAAAKPRILFVTQSKGFRHGPVTRGKQADELSPAEVVVTQLAQSSQAFTVHCTQDSASDFTKSNLQNYDIVWFYTTGDLPIAVDALDYFLNDWLKQPGHGVIGSHSATDTYKNYKPYWDMIGGTFKAHPWNFKEKVTITVHDTQHPTMFGYPASFQQTDEIYEYIHWQPEKVRVLMSLDMSKCRVKRPYHVPVAWVKQYGQGRIYYNNLGHNPETWTDKRFQQSLLHAIEWVAGHVPGDATPNPDVSKLEESRAKAAAPADSAAPATSKGSAK